MSGTRRYNWVKTAGRITPGRAQGLAIEADSRTRCLAALPDSIARAMRPGDVALLTGLTVHNASRALTQLFARECISVRYEPDGRGGRRPRYFRFEKRSPDGSQEKRRQSALQREKEGRL
jgi:hypothetical protein